MEGHGDPSRWPKTNGQLGWFHLINWSYNHPIDFNCYHKKSFQLHVNAIFIYIYIHIHLCIKFIYIYILTVYKYICMYIYTSFRISGKEPMFPPRGKKKGFCKDNLINLPLCLTVHRKLRWLNDADLLPLHPHQASLSRVGKRPEKAT